MYEVQVLTEMITQSVPAYSAHSPCGTEREALLPTCTPATSTPRTSGTMVHCASVRLETLKRHTSPTVRTRGIAWTNLPCRMLMFALALNYDDGSNPVGHAVEIFAKSQRNQLHPGYVLKSAWNKSVASPSAPVAKVAISHIYSTKIPAIPVPFLSRLSFSALSQMHLLPKESFISELRLC